MKGRSVRFVFATLLAFGSIGVAAGTTSASFKINVTLIRAADVQVVGGGSGPSGLRTSPLGVVCISMAEGDGRYALVEVLCTTAAPYVAIEPAFEQDGPITISRAAFTGQAPLTSVLGGRAAFDWQYETGTVTALQLSDVAGDERVLEMLVSF